MRDALYRVRSVNYMPDDVRDGLLEFRVDGVPVGRVRPPTAELLCSKRAIVGVGDDDDAGRTCRVFVVTAEEEEDGGDGTGRRRFLTLSDEIGRDADSRTEAVAQVMEQLRDDEGVIDGWRDELYPVGAGFYNNNDDGDDDDSGPAFLVERAAVPFLGAIEYGVHVNGIVENRTDDDSTGMVRRMWMARRSKTKSKFPGMLDHVVAGGQPAGMTLMDNVVKECWEEAGIPEDLVRAGLRPAGAVSYENYHGPRRETIQRSVLFCYDLVLPADFVPRPVDGEVDEFFLWSIEDILESMAQSYHDPIKPNCYLVVIDFLIRHGYLDPDVPGYLDVLRELRSGDCR